MARSIRELEEQYLTTLPVYKKKLEREISDMEWEGYDDVYIRPLRSELTKVNMKIANGELYMPLF